MRKHLKTHPWLTFKIDLSHAHPRLWMNLGEARSKCEHIAGVPLRPGTASQLHLLYLAKGVLATTAIEGNTLSEEEVLQHLEGKLKLPPSKQYLQQEIDNILRACNLIAKRLLSEEVIELSPGLFKEYNQLVLEGLPLEEGVIPGRLREHSVVVAGYQGAPAEDLDCLLDTVCEWLNGETFKPDQGEVADYGLIKAIMAHLYLAWIHPFADGNGRTARLVEFQILLAAGVPFPAAHLLSNHYNQTRQEYYRQLDRASRSGGDIMPFIEYAIQGFVDGLQAQLQLIRQQQWDVAWRNYVHELFQDKSSVADKRKRDLALALSEEEAPTPVAKIPGLNVRVAQAYSGKLTRTLFRDLEDLRKLDIVEKTQEGFRAKREKILAFLATRKVLGAEENQQ